MAKPIEPFITENEFVKLIGKHRKLFEAIGRL